jgi:hypothetical protein
MTGVRMDMAEFEADGVTPPLFVAIWYEHPKRGDRPTDTEIVALCKRGRFVWVDPVFKRAERSR